MKRALHGILPVAWTFFFLVPTVYIVWWWVESVYEVPIADGSFRFEREWAWLLLPAGLLALIARGWINQRRAPRMKLSRVHDLAVSGRRGWRTYLRHAPTGARVVALTLFALALMGPQSIHARDTAEVEGIDIVLTLDLSLSMQAADIRPNRFEATKEVVDDFVRRRPNDRMGAVVFGRDAYTLMPLTTDKQALRSAIDELELGMIDGRGTAIGNAVGTSLNRLRDSEAASRVIILLTDGDSNSGNVSPEQAAEIARTLPHPLGNEGPNGEDRQGVKIYTILMGRSDDASVQQGTDMLGRPVWDRGNFPINPELLERMAETTGGEYFQVSDREGLERSFHTILDRLERSEIEDPGRVYGELFPAFVWPALALLLFEVLVGTFLLRRWP
ncbi:MAG TPA: VWA domain-containing protein [Sandaracinaceae bacterium LLY-WYZ-13_1]|nr:VWA domain-containing protein [Sandaracinaceae bacterium LLY-WYZ-13_1]